jgi:hypothetical protein
MAWTETLPQDSTESSPRLRRLRFVPDIYASLPGSRSDDQAVSIQMGIPTGSVNKMTGVKNNTTNMQKITTTAITGTNNTHRNNNNTSIISSLGLHPTSSATVSTVQGENARRMLARSTLILQTPAEFLWLSIPSDNRSERSVAERLRISNLTNHRSLILRNYN